MSMIEKQFAGLYNFFHDMHWNIPFYWLLLAYIALIYPLVVAMSHGLYQLQKKKPVEKTVYTAWAIGFMIHVALWIYASDALQAAWYRITPTGRLEFVASGVPMVWALLRLLPYFLLLAFDLFWIVKLLIASQATGGGAVKRRAAARA